MQPALECEFWGWRGQRFVKKNQPPPPLRAQVRLRYYWRGGVWTRRAHTLLSRGDYERQACCLSPFEHGLSKCVCRAEIAACLPRYPQLSQGVPQRCEFDVSLPLNKDSHVAAVRDAVAKTVRSIPQVFLGNSLLTCHLTCFCSNPFFLTTVDAVYQWNVPLQQVVLSGRRLNQHLQFDWRPPSNFQGLL